MAVPGLAPGMEVQVSPGKGLAGTQSSLLTKKQGLAFVELVQGPRYRPRVGFLIRDVILSSQNRQRGQAARQCSWHGTLK